MLAIGMGSAGATFLIGLAIGGVVGGGVGPTEALPSPDGLKPSHSLTFSCVR